MSRRLHASTAPGETSRSSAHAEPRREAIGLRLRELRKEAGLNQTELADRLGIGQAWLSRIELGTRVPTTELVTRVLDALDASASTRQDILDRLDELHLEVSSWRRLHRVGLRRHQDRYGAMEESASEIRAWSDGVVSGLLQTSDYTRAMCEVWKVPELTDVEAIVAGREHRQEILADRTKRFAFLMSEAALRTRDIPAEVMAEQLDRILLLGAMRHIDVGVLPLGVMAPASTGFLLFDDRAVLVELDTTELSIRQPDQVARYLDIFGRLHARARRGADLADLVRGISRDLAGPTPS